MERTERELNGMIELVKRAHSTDKNIHSNPDAQVWAKFFMETKDKNKWNIEDIDEALMIAWFANAMMAMHDSIAQKNEV